MKLNNVFIRLWSAFLTIPMLSILGNTKVQERVHEVLHEITLLDILQNILLVTIVITTFVFLTKISKVFAWSWLSSGTNINLLPTKIRYFGPIFLIILAFNIPLIASIEENIFRKGTVDWWQGFYMSLLFGVAHFFAAAPIGACLAISLSGLWFTHEYFVGGLEQSIVSHTTYDLVVITILFIFSINRHVAEMRTKK